MAGLNFVLNQYQSLDFNKVYLMDLYDQQEDSISFIIKPWGIYDMVQVSAFQNGTSASKQCLIGNQIDKAAERTAFYIVDKGSPVLVSGNYNIKGGVFLPAAGVKYVPFSSENYTNVWSKISKNKSEKDLPDLNHKTLDPLVRKINSISTFVYEHNSIKHSYVQSESIVNQSLDSLVYIVNNQSKTIFPTKYENVTIVSSIPITLDAGSILKNVIVFAPSVTISKGMKASSIQLYCTDSILVKDDVILSYPSVLSVVKKNDLFNPFIRLENNVKVEGCIFTIQKQFEKFDAYIYLNESSTVIGEIYSQGVLEYKGKMIGSIFTNQCNYFSFKSGYNKNTLVDPTIDVLKLPVEYAVHNLSITKNKKVVAQWL